MSDSPSKNLWAAISAIAAVVTIIVSILIWWHGVKTADDPDPAQPASSATAFEPETASGPWQEADTYTVRLAATYLGDDCWDRHVDLDEGGDGEDLHGDREPAPWTDLIWYSCGSWQTAYLYSPADASGTTPAGAGLDPADCNAATSGESPLGLEIDPDYPPSEHGCLVTTEGALAGFSVDQLEWIGAAVEAELTVVVWQRTG